jgi:hypothetical protein
MNEADWEMASELGLRSLRLAAHGVVSGLGEVAQLVEHATENRGVAGSSPALAIAFCLQIRRFWETSPPAATSWRYT